MKLFTTVTDTIDGMYWKPILVKWSKEHEAYVHSCDLSIDGSKEAYRNYDDAMDVAQEIASHYGNKIECSTLLKFPYPISI